VVVIYCQVCAEHPSADGAETVLVSRNVPLGDEKPAPSILKAKDGAKEIQIENEDDWAVPAEDENEESQHMDEDKVPGNNQDKPEQESKPAEGAEQSKAAEEDALPNGTVAHATVDVMADAPEDGKDDGPQEEKPDEANTVKTDRVRLHPDYDVNIFIAWEPTDSWSNVTKCEFPQETSGSPSHKRKHDEVVQLVDKDSSGGEAQKKVALMSAAGPDAVAVGNSAGED
jgi:hypothetical protein